MLKPIHQLAAPQSPTGRRAHLPALVLVLGAVCAAPVLAQGIYRIVGPDGRVTFSDQPPPADAAKATVLGAGGSAGANAVSSLPLALRQPTSRFPVTLYTGEGCRPCDTGRNLLNSRGIPYTEKTVNTAEDAAAFKRLTNETALPVLTIGAQKIQGFADAEWSQYLDAAGYPKSSMLPPNYRRAAATALVAVQPLTATSGVAPAPVAAPAGSRTAPARNADEVPIDPSINNPSGIRF